MSQLLQKLEALHERDQALGFVPVTRADELPLSFEAITDAWLTDVLCRDVPGAAVIAHRLGVADDGSSNRRKIQVDYNAQGIAAGLPTGLFGKASHGLANRIVLGITRACECEANFYTYIRPLLDIEAPVAYFAKVDLESYNSILLLRDIADEVQEFGNHTTVITRARAESQMRLLGRLHGKGYSDPAIIRHLDKFPTWPEIFHSTLAFDLDKGCAAGFQAAESVIPAGVFRRADEIWPATLRSVERHNELPRTYVHSDVHLRNWYVAGNGEMALSDWQCSGRGHWGRDFAYAMTTGLTVENRRLWERDLLRFYLEELRANGGPEVDFDEAWQHYRQQLMTALAWWTITMSPTAAMPDMQPQDSTLEFIRRIATAMDDVDTLDSF